MKPDSLQGSFHSVNNCATESSNFISDCTNVAVVYINVKKYTLIIDIKMELVKVLVHTKR